MEKVLINAFSEVHFHIPIRKISPLALDFAELHSHVWGDLSLQIKLDFINRTIVIHLFVHLFVWFLFKC